MRRIVSDTDTDVFGQYNCLECGPGRPQHYIKQAERHLVCVTSSCLNNWMTAATYDKNSKGNKYMSTGRASPAELSGQ